MSENEFEIFRDTLWSSRPEWFMNKLEEVMRLIHILTNDFSEDELVYEEFASFAEIYDSSIDKGLTLQRFKMAVELLDNGVDTKSACDRILNST